MGLRERLLVPALEALALVRDVSTLEDRIVHMLMLEAIMHHLLDRLLRDYIFILGRRLEGRGHVLNARLLLTPDLLQHGLWLLLVHLLLLLLLQLVLLGRVVKCDL